MKRFLDGDPITPSRYTSLDGITYDRYEIRNAAIGIKIKEGQPTNEATIRQSGRNGFTIEGSDKKIGTVEVFYPLDTKLNFTNTTKTEEVIVFNPRINVKSGNQIDKVTRKALR